MTAVLVDSNVILDVAGDRPPWATWSSEALDRASANAPLVINPLIYAEVSTAYARIEELDAALPESSFRRDALPYAAGFLAAKAFLIYRQRGGTRTSPMPDFYIGAHAALAGFRLLTRDPTRYRTYFPSLKLIAPEGAGGPGRN